MLSNFIWAVLFGTLLRQTACNQAPIVYVPRQRVSYYGSSAGPVEHFQGIRFAKDTANERRFAPPEPYVPKADSAFDASRAGSVCPQIESAIPLFFDETPEMSEDCLNLRIARPATASPESKLPVLVWLHGGGVVKGSAYDSHFDPDNLLQSSIADGMPVIYAAINYRMTIFGFPRLPLLKDKKSLNLGLRDQRLGLQWIQQNIRAFGGDPERITVYGLSAGGTFAGLHTMAYGGQHGVPFQQAWMMSGPPGTALNMTSNVTAAHTRNVAERLNCGGSIVDDAAMLGCLRDVPMKELLDVALTYSRENHPPLGLFTFIPSVDEDMFPDAPSRLIRDGRFTKGINMIFGWTQDDGALNVGDAQAVQSEDDMLKPILNFASNLSATQVSGLFALYPAEAFQEELERYEILRAPVDPMISVNFLRASRILRDLLFTCPSLEYGYQMVKQTVAKQPGFDGVRLYQLNQSVFTPMMAAAGMPYLGAVHGSDTPYIFNGFPEGQFSDQDQQLADYMSQSLIHFAHSGVPTPLSATPNLSHNWPAAYPSTFAEEPRRIPSMFNVQVLGGPHGTGPALAKNHEGKYQSADQAILGDPLDFASMSFASDASREQAIRKEDLHKRCEFLGALDETLGR